MTFLKQIDPYIENAGIAISEDGEKFNRSHSPATGRFSSGGGGGGARPLSGQGGNMGAGEIAKSISKTKVGDYVEIHYSSGTTPLRAGKVSFKNEAGTRMEVSHIIGKGTFKVDINQNGISKIVSRRSKD